MGQEKKNLKGVDHERIRAAASDIVLVDGHAHNLVDLDSSFSFLRAFAEAGDDMLADIPHTIPFKRSVDDIAGLYEVDATLESIEEHRKRVALKVLSAKCFEAANIGTILLDDGIAMDKMMPTSWHKSIVSKVHRILRIETVAEELLKQDPPGGLKHWNFKVLEEQFLSTLKSQLSSVVGFKSIAASRSGLNIDPTVTDQDAEEGLVKDINLATTKKKPVRLQDKAVIDMLFIKALELATSQGIPVQLHTGFGDKDLDLRLANPLHLRSVLEDQRFSSARLVLLHASYPYMREATYLASVYPQVFLDFGLAIPKLTVRGMKTAIAELLELAPINKVMFSTDGYAFPETYFLGAKWARTILAQVLCEAYDDGDLSVGEAISAAEAVLRTNSLVFYKLEEESGETASSLNSTQEQETGNDWKNVEREAEKKVTEDLRHKGDSSGIGKFHRSSSWLDNVKYVRILWGDGAGKRRCRVVPTARYKSVVAEYGVGLTHACMGMSSMSDGPAEGSGLSGVGEIRLIPDATTGLEVPEWGHGLVLADMCEKPGTPWAYCPRNTLRRLIELLNKEFGLELKAGFETEFYLLRKIHGVSNYEGVDSTSYCSTNALNESSATIEKILSWMETFEIDIEQFHAEAGGGQFEFALAYDTASRIADKLLLAREAITVAASTQNLIATFLPKLQYAHTLFGSGSHVHLSLWRDGKNVFGADSYSSSNHGLSETGTHFMAGLLQHLPAVLAFTAPHPASYRRIQPNTWSGAYQCWGQQNREAPMRTILDEKTGVVSNFELKSFDGCANPHLGLAAIIAAGLDGLRRKLELPAPVDVNPAELLIGMQVLRLPSNLEEATEHLQSDSVLRELLGEKLVTAIVAIRKAESGYEEQRGYDHFGTQDILIRNY
ncbi:unnamed protein product [Calypogeia fissa]